MDYCSNCGHDIAEDAAFCEACEHENATAPADPVQQPHDSTAAGAPPAAAAASPQKSAIGFGRRELLIVIVAVLGGGTVTLAMLMGSGNSASTGTPSAASSSRPASSRSATANAPLAPKWTEATERWTGRSRKAYAFEVPAEHRVAAWQRSAEPILVVRCIAGETEAFVYIESAAKLEAQDENHTVRLGFDDRAETVERWPDSDEHDALFAPDGAAFAQRLSQARTLRFGYTPHNAAPVVAEFTVFGLADALAPVTKTCVAKK
jgi:hypothetical protein